jgi:hypothetical protein
MKCIRCNSLRIIRFLDGFGQRRIFCKTCGSSFLDMFVVKFDKQLNLNEFSNNLYYNARALRR